jgi:PBP1b-binding outer membrane lipoprotein LpoB
MKKLLSLIPLAALILVGCNSGDTPVETVNVPKDKAPQKDSMQGAIQGNPNIPDAAKKQILNQGK